MAKQARKLLLPGQYYITDSPMILETIVGSCVAVCLYNRRSRASAMNHFLIARPDNPNDADIGRYGSTSTEYIIKRLFANDSVKEHYLGQIFGGAAVLSTSSQGSDVGKKNLAAALEVLSAYRIEIIRSETCGVRGRRIKFDTATNIVDCRFTGDISRKKKFS